MKSILITGCNRGLGLGIVKYLLMESKPPQHLFATCRNVDQAQELQDIAKEHENVHILKLDVTDMDSYGDVVARVQEVVGAEGLNVLFNNAGIAPRSTRLGLVKADQMIDTYVTNTVAPVMLTKAFVPLLKLASGANNSLEMGVCRAAVLNMSSILGSISMNDQGGFYPYRCSKAALNASTKSMSVDLRGDKILVVSLHPGWVRTGLGGASAPLDVAESVQGMMETIKGLREEHNGSFMQWDGQKLEW